MQMYIYIYTRHWPKTPPAVLLSGFYWRHCLSGFVETRGSTFRPCAWYSRAGLRWVRVDFSPDEHRFLAYLLHEIIYNFFLALRWPTTGFWVLATFLALRWPTTGFCVLATFLALRWPTTEFWGNLDLQYLGFALCV